jgi:hypothetical protein
VVYASDCEQASEQNRPPPPSDDVRLQWDESGLRHRLMRGAWRNDADDRLKEFFAEETWDYLPRTVLAFNPHKMFAVQTATLFDGAVTVHVADQPEADVAALGLDLLWPQQQETLEHVRSANDCFVLRSWDSKRQRVRYMPVPPDCVDVEPDPDDPTQPCRVVHYRRRSVVGLGKVWCRDTYDFSARDPDGRIVPLLQIEAWVKRRHQDAGSYDEGRWVDVTYEVMPELRPRDPSAPPPVDADGNEIPAPPPRRGQWPYWTDATEDAEPIWCWTAYHARVGTKLLDTWSGCELVDGTLITAVLWTYWLGGFRDVAYQQRWMLDADIAAKPPASPGSQSVGWVASNPMAVMKLKSTETGRPGSAGQWAQPFDVEKAAQAISNFMASLALFAGLSPADVSIGNAGLSRTSGYAIEVSRDGRRKVEKRMVAPIGIADRHNLAHAAMLSNAYAGTDLPTEPEAYTVVYSETPRTVEEIRVEVESNRALTEAGLRHPAEALRILEPHLTADQARAKVLDIARFKAELAAAADGGNRPDPDEILAGLAAVDELVQQVHAFEASTGQQMPGMVHDRLRTIRESMAGMVDNAPPMPEAQPSQRPADPAPQGDQQPAVEGGTVATPEAPEGAPLAATALNGAQVTSALQIVQAVAEGQLPRASAKAMLRAFFQLSEADAEAVLGEVGNGFSPTPKAVPPPFGGAPPKPPEGDGEEAEEEDESAETA